KLLAQREERAKFLRPAFVGEKADIVAHGIGRPETDHALRHEPLLVDDLLQHRLRIVEKLPRGGTLLLVFEDLRVATLQFPGLEERSPVDIAGKLGQVPGLEDLQTEERW